MTAIPVITGGTVDEAASDADLQALTARVAALEAKGSGTTPPPPSGPTPPISLAWTAPAAAASLAGLVPLVLSGSDLVNVEIFDGGTMLIRLTCSPDGTSATGNLDTTALTNGGLTLVATAWNAPAGQGTSTTLTTQAIRNFTVANPASSGGGTTTTGGSGVTVGGTGATTVSGSGTTTTGSGAGDPPATTTPVISGSTFSASGFPPGYSAPAAQPDGSVGNFFDGSWVEYAVDFLTGMDEFNAEISCAPGYAGTLDLCLGSPTGTVIGTLAASSTGGWSTYHAVSSLLNTVISGPQQLFIVSAGGKANILNFSFSTGGTPPAAAGGSTTGATGGTTGGTTQPGAITTAMSFSQACAAIGVNPSQVFAFGTGATGAAPTIPITDEAQLATYFNPRDTYDTPYRGKNGEWEVYATSLSDTQAFEFTPASLKLNAYIPAGGGVRAQGITAGQIVLKELLQPGVAPAGNKALAGELVAKVPNEVGAWPAFWMYQAANASGGGCELDVMECPVSANGVWGTNLFVDGTGITPSSLQSMIYSNPAFDGYKVPLPIDMSQAFHKFQFIWTPTQYWVYLDGVLMFAFNYNYNASKSAELMINLAVGTSTWGQPGMDPTSAAQFPFAYELEQLTIFTA